jgi:hypothetical protein
MMRILSILFLLSTFTCFCQSENWSLINEYEVKNLYAWDVDPMGKIIYAQRDAITKLDSSFKIQFTQSVKGFGNISKIDARHSLKTLIFSEDQQSIAFMDNTLTFKDSKDLSLIDVAYGTHASYSAQTSRYWIFDGDNSKLVMYDEARNNTQVMENLSGTLGFLDLEELFEIENILLLFDKSKGIYLFDIYGTMIDFFATENAKAIHYENGRLFYLTDKELVRISLKVRKERRIKLPTENITNFRVLGNYIFFQTEIGLKKYLLKKMPQ